MVKAKGKAAVLYVVIMAGGVGRRFWPKSRENRPKQLLAIGTREPLIRETVSRLAPLVPAERIFISCGKKIAPKIAEIVPEIPSGNFILEPVGRDTAPCVGLSLEFIRNRVRGHESETVIAVLPADHSIKKPGKFRTTLSRASRAACKRGLIVTIGIVPDRPSPAYGYLQPGAPIPGEKGVMRLKKFVEKPDAKTAKKYLANRYLWNAGMFVFRLDVMRDAYKEHLPKMFRGLEKIGDSFGSKNHGQVLSRTFPRLEKISIDYGIMEKVKEVAMIPGDFDWCDVGGWDALYRLLGGDGKKNITRGKVELVDSTGCYVEGERTVALIGVDNLVVVETEDALLVINRDRDADLKKLTDQLIAKGKNEVL